jgi:hypothetical protein
MVRVPIPLLASPLKGEEFLLNPFPTSFTSFTSSTSSTCFTSFTPLARGR